ncbi:hypothetical protein DFH28DRAFT_1000937 [Melampsora americana]|nr:hypothetical protein DFH28DRAFT_1000937 [Melampsora americana]
MSEQLQDSNRTDADILKDEALWEGLVPIPQADIERPMVPIAYSPEYRMAMDLFRALLKANELSERALELTRIILKFNPSHYPVWTYRGQVIVHFHRLDPSQGHIKSELKMLEEKIKTMLKSYQVWQHRRNLILALQDPGGEMAFVKQALDIDAKNYNTWAYRQWVLCEFNLPDMWAGELSFIEKLLENDIRNNSAWNHRFFIQFETNQLHDPNADIKSLAATEVEWTKRQIYKAPNNLSAWNYLRGVLKIGEIPLSALDDFVIPLTKSSAILSLEIGWPTELNPQSDLPVVNAVEFLADSLAAQAKLTPKASDQASSKASESAALYTLLSDKLDPIRHTFWSHKANLVTSLA